MPPGMAVEVYKDLYHQLPRRFGTSKMTLYTYFSPWIIYVSWWSCFLFIFPTAWICLELPNKNIYQYTTCCICICNIRNVQVHSITIFINREKAKETQLSLTATILFLLTWSTHWDTEAPFQYKDHHSRYGYSYNKDGIFILNYLPDFPSSCFSINARLSLS